MFEEIW